MKLYVKYYLVYFECKWNIKFNIIHALSLDNEDIQEYTKLHFNIDYFLVNVFFKF